MAGIDDHVAIIGDWVPPSPSPRMFFSMMLGDDVDSRATSEPTNENRNEAGDLGDQLTEFGAFSDQKLSSRGGLVERIAARAGFNAPRLNTESIRSADLSLNPDVRSPYLTIPPGLSPTTLLESPVFLSTSHAQPSPTTGKFPFIPNVNNRSSMLIPAAPDRSKEDLFEDFNTSSFAFKPVAESGSSFFNNGASKISAATIPQQSFPSIEVSVQSENSLPSQIMEPTKVHSQIGSAEHSPPLDEQQDEDGDQRGGVDNMVGGAPAEDGYNWRKYGQKQVKGSEFPRSYYKCTHPNCQVKKKVERSHEGHITEIIYKGAHNHSKPPPNRRSAIGSSNPLSDMQLDIPEQAGPHGGDGDPGQNGAPFESSDAVDASSTFSNDEDDDDRVTHGSVSLGYDGEGDESESKRRKVEAYATEMSGATRAIREPRVVVQTTSEVDILDDGYRWRKYGQKVVKGNPNPRSYYKCTNAGCTVRKHVERASHDLKSVITTYEGKHNHDVPAARNSSHVNSVHNMARFDRPPSFGTFNLPGRQQLGPSHGFSFGMNQPGLANLGMAGLGPTQGKLPALPVHPYLGQQRQVNEMGFMLPKGEPKVEPMSEPSLNLSSGSAVYHQIMSRLPLGPQM
ncbi:unnamed protein product, partial [Vitis vinifera]